MFDPAGPARHPVESAFFSLAREYFPEWMGFKSRRIFRVSPVMILVSAALIVWPCVMFATESAIIPMKPFARSARVAHAIGQPSSEITKSALRLSPGNLIVFARIPARQPISIAVSPETLLAILSLSSPRTDPPEHGKMMTFFEKQRHLDRIAPPPDMLFTKQFTLKSSGDDILFLNPKFVYNFKKNIWCR